jgi:hypothetical protein
MEHEIRHQHQQKNGAFCWVRAEAVSGEEKHKPVSPTVCRQTNQLESEVVVREAWQVEELIFYVVA